MPHYHFHTSDCSPDLEGSELEDLAAAKCEAVKTAGHVICDAAGTFWDRAEWTMTVTDEDGLILFILQIVGVESAATQGQHVARLNVA